MKTAAQGSANWAASAPRAATAWQEGVQSTNADWAGNTTRQQAVALQAITAAFTSGRWADGINRKGNQGWKADTLAKAPNFAVGFNAGAQRQAASMTKILNAEANIVAGLPPRGDFNQNVARSVSVQTQLHALKGTLGA